MELFKFSPMVVAGFVVVAGFAGVASRCPRGDDDCPILQVILGFVLGAVAGVGYMLLFLGKRSLECCDLIALILVAYLFTYFISSLFPGKKTT